MITKPYYILFVYDTETQKWFDEFGDYTKDNTKSENIKLLAKTWSVLLLFF